MIPGNIHSVFQADKHCRPVSTEINELHRKHADVMQHMKLNIAFCNSLKFVYQELKKCSVLLHPCWPSFSLCRRPFFLQGSSDTYANYNSIIQTHWFSFVLIACKPEVVIKYDAVHFSLSLAFRTNIKSYAWNAHHIKCVYYCYILMKTGRCKEISIQPLNNVLNFMKIHSALSSCYMVKWGRSFYCCKFMNRNVIY